MSAVDLAVLDLAGTTVRDDGLVEDAFVDALASVGAGPDTAGFTDRLAHLRTTMGRSKLEVFREMLGDDATARVWDARPDQEMSLLGRGPGTAAGIAARSRPSCGGSGTRRRRRPGKWWRPSTGWPNFPSESRKGWPTASTRSSSAPAASRNSMT